MKIVENTTSSKKRAVRYGFKKTQDVDRFGV